MRLLLFLKTKALYIVLSLLVFLVGAFLINKGVVINSSNNTSGGIYISIGTSIIAASIVAVLDLFKQLSIASALQRHNNVITEAGVGWIYKKRDLDKYDTLMNSLKSGIDVAGYSLGAFFDSYSKLIKARAAGKNLIVRILLVKPLSAYSINRAAVEGRNAQQFSDKIDTLKNFFHGVPGVEIRYINAPLSSMIFRIDDTMFIGPHFYGVQSKATFTMELKAKHWLYEEFQQEFDRMWSVAVV